MGEKYFYLGNVCKADGTVSAQMLGYDTPTEAEIKFCDEVSYALKLDDVVIAHFEVKTESGMMYDMLQKTIDNRKKYKSASAEE